MIEKKQIEDRIKGLTAELKALEASHNAMVQEQQKKEQQFREKVAANQTRFANLTGAIEELKNLSFEPSENNAPSRKRVTVPARG